MLRFGLRLVVKRYRGGRKCEYPGHLGKGNRSRPHKVGSSMVSIETMGMTRMDKTVKVLRYIPIANENYGFADAETTLNFDRMWKRPSRPHISAMGICCYWLGRWASRYTARWRCAYSEILMCEQYIPIANEAPTYRGPERLPEIFNCEQYKFEQR